MSEPHIIRDIASKCDADVADVIRRNMRLVEGGSAMAQVAYFGAASALGSAGGAFVAIHDSLGDAQASDEQVADALWSTLRPMVLRSIASIRKQEKA